MFSDFKPKGRRHKEHKQILIIKQVITKERASRLEGSFCKVKELNHLIKIKAK